MSKNEVIAVVKLALDPDAAARKILDGQSKICNYLYNTLLERAHKLRQHYIKTQDQQAAKIVYSERGLRDLLPELKEEQPFLKVVHSAPLKNSALRLSAAIQAHQKSKRGKRRGNLVGWPQFRSWKAAWFSLFYDEPEKGFKVEGDALLLSLGMGEERKRRSVSIPIKEAGRLKGAEIRNLRIVKQLGIFSAVFTVLRKVPEKQPVRRTIALDPNHKNLAHGVDTEGQSIEIAAPQWLKNYDKRLDELKSRRDRCTAKARQVAVVDEQGKATGTTYWQPSKRWTHYNTTIERMLRKRREQSKTFLFTAAHSLYSRYDCVGIGDYTPHGEGITTSMRRAMNNRSLIGGFKKVLSWVAVKSGKVFVEYPEQGTTRTCHCCQHVVAGGLSPAIRAWTCPQCGNAHLRDENAAKNGLKQVLRDLSIKNENTVLQVSCSDLVSVTKRWAWRVLPSGVVYIPRGQNCELFAATGN